MNSGVLERIWQGIYCRGEPDDAIRLRGLDLSCGTDVPVCLGTAAALHGFDTEEPADLHVLSPPGSSIALSRWACGAPPRRRTAGRVGERPATSPAWTAVEVARSLRRPRALADTRRRVAQRDAASASELVASSRRAGGTTGHSRGPRPDSAGRRHGGIADGERSPAGDDRRRPAASRIAIRDHRRQRRAAATRFRVARSSGSRPSTTASTGTAALKRCAGSQASGRALRTSVDRDADRVRGCQVPGVGLRCPDRRAASSRSRGVSDRKMPRNLRRVVYRHGRSRQEQREGR